MEVMYQSVLTSTLDGISNSVILGRFVTTVNSLYQYYVWNCPFSLGHFIGPYLTMGLCSRLQVNGCFYRPTDKFLLPFLFLMSL
jgi:hypothetical protein